MSLLVGENVVKNYAAQEVLRRISFRIEHRDRIGVVGPNGEGKTTLLNVIAEKEELTTGNIERKKGLRVGYLPQKPPPLEDVTLWAFLREVFDDLLAMEHELAELSEKLATAGDDADLLRRFSEVQTAFEAQGGYAYETRMKQVLEGLGFGHERYGAHVDHLSGGERTRALLGRLLLEEADLLLLDEPTNHLDLTAVEWLEQWLRDFPGALVIVSHDRYFLDQVAKRTWEVSFGGLEAYRGNYTEYVKKRQERYEQRMREWQAQQAYVEKTEAFIRQHLAGQRTKEAQGRRSHLERFLIEEAIPKPREHKRMHIRFADPDRSGDRVLQLNGLAVGYPWHDPLVRLPDMEVWRGQRIAIVGDNGSGKTTLLRTILGEVQPLEGEIKRGTRLELGYLAQVHDGLDTKSTVLDALREVDPDLKEEDARTRLGAFLFSGDDVFKTIDQLSGGERSRVVLARMTTGEPNLLLLDEPTNHLDIASQEALQDVLADFPGTLMLVSHDRYLVQALTNQLWIVDDGALTVLPGQWEDYLNWRQEKAVAKSAPDEAKRRREEERQENRRAEQKKRRQIEKLSAKQTQLETRIAEQELALKGLGEAISKAGETGQNEEVRRLGEEYAASEAALKSLWDQWTETGETIESLDQQ